MNYLESRISIITDNKIKEHKNVNINNDSITSSLLSVNGLHIKQGRKTRKVTTRGRIKNIK